VARHPDLERILLDASRLLRVRGYSPRTRKAYLGWIRRFLYSQPILPPSALRTEHVHRWLRLLTDEVRLAARSRNQAASALAFMFREVRTRRADRGQRARSGEAAYSSRAC